MKDAHPFILCLTLETVRGYWLAHVLSCGVHRYPTVLPLYSLKREARVIVLSDMDDPARNKPVLFQQILHHCIVSMSVDPQVSALPKCPLKAEAPNTLDCPIAGDSVDNTVRTCIQLGTLFNVAVSGFDVISVSVEESPDDTAALDTDVAVAGGNVRTYQFLWRPLCRPPLIRIPMLRHEGSGPAVYLHDDGQV